MKYILLILGFFAISNCSTPQKSIEKYNAAWSNSEWTDILSIALDKYGSDLLNASPGDAKEYSYAKGKQFWISLISEMARYESGFNPASKYTEAFADANGVRVVSRGLLQISIESGRGYKCDIPTAESLHDPRVNLECAVRILNRWVPKDGVIGTDKKGGARYWSVLRESNPARAKILKALKP